MTDYEQNLNLQRNLGTANHHREIDNRFAEAIRTNSSTKVDHLVRVYSKRGASRSAIIDAITRASAGKLKVKSFSDSDVDMATLLFRLGGRKLVYAANKHLGLPSSTTVRSRGEITTLLPSVCGPNLASILHNISEVFGKSHIELEHCGHSVQIDEIASEERPVYIKWLGSISGLCNCVKGLDLKVTSIAAMKNLASLVFGINPTVHLAKEQTVAAIGALRQKYFGVKPIFIQGTCKRDTADDMVNIIETIIKAWEESPDGEKRHGPIWSFASDGDGVRRSAFHRVFMNYTLKKDDPLYSLLGSLPGFNHGVGLRNRTAEYDPKHLDKSMDLFGDDSNIDFDCRSINTVPLRRWHCCQ